MIDRESKQKLKKKTIDIIRISEERNKNRMGNILFLKK